MRNKTANNMKELFENTFIVFMKHLACQNNISLNDLVKKSNENEELRNEIQEMFLASISKTKVA